MKTGYCSGHLTPRLIPASLAQRSYMPELRGSTWWFIRIRSW